MSSGAGWALILTFVIAGLTAIQSHFTGNVAADITTVIAILGIFTHPTTPTGAAIAQK